MSMASIWSSTALFWAKSVQILCFVLFCVSCGGGATTSSSPSPDAAPFDVAPPPPRDPMELRDVRFFGYQIQRVDAPKAVDALVASRYDLLILEPTETNWISSKTWSFNTNEMVRRLKASTAHDGVHRKLVLAYIDLGEAESWRWYWTWSRVNWRIEEWKKGVSRPKDWPEYIVYPDPDGWADNYPVAFWDKRWKNIVLEGDGLSTKAHGGEYHSIVDEVIGAGFDGVYLDWVEAYSDAEVMRAAERAGVNPAMEMIQLVKEIREYGRKRNPHFLVIQQNAADLSIDHPELFKTIDAISQEGIWFRNIADVDWDDPRGYDLPRSPDETRELVPLLTSFRSAGVPVLTVDYTVGFADKTYRSSAELGFVPYCTQSSLQKLTTTPPPGY